jgi:hypothetical protein
MKGFLGYKLSDEHIEWLKQQERVIMYSKPNRVTKGSGPKMEFSTGMQRDINADKARFDLIVPEGIPYEEQLLTRFAELMQRGAVKYSARNWEKARTKEEMDRFKESAYRHFMQWFCGEEDEDHAVAVLFNIMGFETTKYKYEQPV